MQKTSLYAMAAAAVAAVAVPATLFLFTPTANSQIRATPAMQVMGTSASGSTSTAWFHDASGSRAVACQTVNNAAGLASIQCVSTKLPQE
jgi:hypothetical protein